MAPLVAAATSESSALAAASKTSKLATTGKVVAVGAGVLGGIWLIPQVLTDTCKRSASMAGLPPSSCAIGSVSCCCVSCVAVMVGAMTMMK